MCHTLYEPMSTESKDLRISEQETHWVKSNRPPNPTDEEKGSEELRSLFSKVTLVRSCESTKKQEFQFYNQDTTLVG